MGPYGSSKIAGQFLVEVLSKEIGARGVTVNSILRPQPTAPVSSPVEYRRTFVQFIQSIRPIKRMGTVDDVADAAEYLASNLAGFVSGQHLLIGAVPGMTRH